METNQLIFLDVQPDTIRSKLHKAGAVCINPLRRIQNYIFFNPQDPTAYIRLQYDGGKITTLYKQTSKTKPKGYDYSHTLLFVDNIEAMKTIYIKCGLSERSIQEMYRETWTYKNVFITLERRPGLRPFVKIKCDKKENSFQEIIQMLGYSINEGLDGTVVGVYTMKYSMTVKQFCETPLLTFDNPPA